jgi:hypothetical protein
MQFDIVLLNATNAIKKKCQQTCNAQAIAGRPLYSPCISSEVFSAKMTLAVLGPTLQLIAGLNGYVNEQQGQGQEGEQVHLEKKQMEQQ